MLYVKDVTLTPAFCLGALLHGGSVVSLAMFGIHLESAL